MARLVCFALFSIFMATAAAAQLTTTPEAWRLREIQVPVADRQLPALDVGPTGQLGSACSESNPRLPATGRSSSVTSPRRATAGREWVFP